MHNYEKFVYLPDPHGDHQCERSNNMAYDFIQDFKPEHVIAGGDVFDFRNLRKGASQEDQMESMAKDVRMGKEWLRRFKPTVYLRGNHCERLWETAEYHANGMVMDIAQSGVNDIENIVAELGCHMIRYWQGQVHKIGQAKFAHGHMCPMHTAKATAEFYGAGTTFVGHTHSVDYYRAKGIDRCEAFVCGCLSRLDVKYAERRGNTSRWENGFAYGLIHKVSGEVMGFQARGLDNGDWIFPSEIMIKE